MNKKILTVLIMASIASHATNSNDPSPEIQKARDEWTRKYFESRGMPAPDGGVKIIPAKEMSSYASFKESRLKANADMQKYGYVKSENAEAQALLMLPHKAAEILKKQTSTPDPKDSTIRATLEELNLKYQFKSVPNDVASSVIGFAPAVSYSDENGWAGAVEFFKDTQGDVCVYSENNLKFSHGAINIAKEDVKTIINGKYSTLEVAGNSGTGFTYSVEWYDQDFFKKLECATRKFDKKKIAFVVSNAVKIDS